MPYVDQIVMSALAAALLGSITLQWRRGLRGGHLVAAIFALYFGLTLIVMLGAHCTDIVWAIAHHTPSMSGRPMTFDWHSYSLLLFGALLVGQGAACVRAAVRMGPEAPAERVAVLRRAAFVLAIVLPLVAIHPFFGYLMGGVCGVTLAAVGIGGRQMERSGARSALRVTRTAA